MCGGLWEVCSAGLGSRVTDRTRGWGPGTPAQTHWLVHPTRKAIIRSHDDNGYKGTRSLASIDGARPVAYLTVNLVLL